MYMYVRVRVCMYVFPQRPEEGLDPLELELHMVMSYLLQMLGIELGSSARATSALNCLVSSQVLLMTHSGRS